LRHVHNKLWICASQGVEHGPHGVDPDRYPVFSKPIYNMRGMGTGGRPLRCAAAYRAHLQPGHMWMRHLSGPHVSSDIALVRGEARWIRHTTGLPRRGGTFDRWIVHAEAYPTLDDRLSAWCAMHLVSFTGIVNLETIGGTIIECHLRMAEQWLDLNGVGWLEAVVELYSRGRWAYADADRQTGYSVVLFALHAGLWRPPARKVLATLRARSGISSIQITFHPRRAPSTHAMPPGGFRLAIVNCRDLSAGRATRRALAAAMRPA